MQIAHWQQTDSPNIALSWLVICQHGRASQLSLDNIPIRCASTLGCSIHINIMPHSHCSARRSQSLLDSIKNGHPLSPSRRVWRLALRFARWVKQEWHNVCQPLSDCLLVLQLLPLSDPFPTVTYPRPLATSVSSNAKHVRHLCKKTKIVQTDLPFGSPAPSSCQNLHSGSVTLRIFSLVNKSLPFNFTPLFRMQINIICW